VVRKLIEIKLDPRHQQKAEEAFESLLKVKNRDKDTQVGMID